jgi:hypothetical protein
VGNIASATDFRLVFVPAQGAEVGTVNGAELVIPIETAFPSLTPDYSPRGGLIDKSSGRLEVSSGGQLAPRLVPSWDQVDDI